MFKKVKIVGIEEKSWVDDKTKQKVVSYYVHCEVIGSPTCIAGHCVFVAKLADECVCKVEVGKECLLAYTSYKGYNRVVEVV